VSRPRRRSVDLDGFLVVDKPAGMTSHDVVARIRRMLDQPKTGHAGTLDPDATGVLIVGLGRATRLMRFAVGLSKSYTCAIVLGTSTSTLDAAGEITGTFEMSQVTLEEARTAASKLTGVISQIPPMVSAIKVGGRRLHELAREGVEVERSAREVEVSRFDLDFGEHPGVLRASIDCSSGTYVRSLAADLGSLLGGGAHLRELRRTSVGHWRVEDALQLNDLTAVDVLPPVGLVGHLRQCEVGPELSAAIAVGKVLDRRALGVHEDGPWAVCDASGSLVAVYESWDGGRVKPAVVMRGAE